MSARTVTLQVPDGPDLEVLQVGTGGPMITILGGVHGDELEGVLAARMVAEMLGRSTGFHGQARILPRANPGALADGTRLGPDGANLARCFPGDRAGGPTRRLASVIAERLIAGTDLLIDLHAAGRRYRMPPMIGLSGRHRFQDRPLTELVAHTPMPYRWVHPRIAPGRSVSHADELGIGWLYLESGGGGALRRRDLELYVDTVRTLLVAAGLLDPEPADNKPTPTRQIAVTDGDGNTDEGLCSPATGLFVQAVRAGDPVREGQRLGTVHDGSGQVLHQLHAERSGRVMMLRHELKVNAGEVLAIVAGEAGQDAP